jgi:two-component system, NarL family, sensor histidine kinase EvgS
MLKIHKTLSIRAQLLGLFAMVLLASVGLFLFDEWDRYQGRLASEQLRSVSLNNVRTIKIISDSYGLEYVDTTFRVRNYLISWDEGIKTVADAQISIDNHWQLLQNADLTPQQRALVSQINIDRKRADAVAIKLRGIFALEDIVELGKFADTELFPAIDPIRLRLKTLADLELVRADTIVEMQAKRAKRAAMARAVIIVLPLLLFLLLARSISRNIYKGVESLRSLTVQMQRRDFQAMPSYRSDGELGEVLDSFLSMRDEVKRYEEDLNVQLADNEEVRHSLQESEIFQRSLLAAARVAVMSLDLQGRFTSMNPFGEVLSGYHAEEIIGERCLEKMMLPGEIQKLANQFSAALDKPIAMDESLLTLLTENTNEPMELTLIRKDGTHVPVLLASSAMRDSTGKVTGLLGVATDLSQIKQLEKKLRNSELTAREANVAKSNFLAAMSHEIRTPMIGVTGMLEVLSHSKLDNEQRRTMDIIQQSAASLLQIIGDILDFSKVEAGRMELSLAATSFSQLLQTTCDNFTDFASSKGLVLNVMIDPKIGPAYYADGLRLRQILSNFLSNAIKFTQAGFIEAALEYQGKVEGKDRICFRVTDTGIGIKPEQQKRLFQAFQQAEDSTTRRYGGSGLGLVICKRLAELMDGEVRLDSSLGHGTTLLFSADFAAANPNDIEDIEHAKQSLIRYRPLPSVAAAEKERSLILVVDDHPTNRIVVGKQLALAGFACEFAEDGEQGIAQWRSGRFALILSDVHMPVMDGYQMSREIRNIEKAQRMRPIPIIALTAAALKGDAERCIAAGMDDYLMKPVNIEQLAQCVHTWLPHITLSDAETPKEKLLITQAKQIVALPGSQAPILADEMLHELTGGDLRETLSLLNDFVRSTEQDLSALKRALIANDPALLSREAHKIKGAAKLVGAMQLALSAEHLELSAKHDGSSKDELTVLAQHVFNCVAEFEKHLQGLEIQKTLLGSN